MPTWFILNYSYSKFEEPLMYWVYRQDPGSIWESEDVVLFKLEE